MKPNTREKQLQLTAKLLVYVCEKTGVQPENWILHEVENVYARDERLVPTLCGMLRAMDDAQRNTLIYNAHERNARDLANWWEDHQEADVAREKREADAHRGEREIAVALAKLSKRERELLGLRP